MQVILASSEIDPFAKTGGLADVSSALPRALEKRGHQLVLFMPAYRCIAESGLPIETTDIRFEIPLGDNIETGRLLKSHLPESQVPVYFVDHPDFFDRHGLYGHAGTDFRDNCERYAFFCRAVLDSVRLLSLKPDLIHANDWQTGLIPALLKCEFAENPDYAKVAALFTIHNLAYQGIFDAQKMALTGLDSQYFNWQQMEYFGQLNLMKSGIVFADSINTVSPTYAREIQTPEQGCGLNGLLQQRSHCLSGIINGIDKTEWCPATDPLLFANYDADFDLNTGPPGKAVCKRELQREMKLELNPDIPLIGIVGRLATQKGWSLILPILRQWLESMPAQWVILGTGDPEYYPVLTSLHRSHANKLGIQLGFSNELAHRIESGADMFLMPSQYEPCGLNQLYSMAYGTIPIVRQTGGLADTVIDATPETIKQKTATGFSFESFSPVALHAALRRAVTLYRDQRVIWNQLVATGMKRDWSWDASAQQYESLYRQTILRKSVSQSREKLID